MEYSLSISDLLVAVLVLIASGLGFIIREQKEKIKTINSQLSEKKYNLYHDIYSIFFDLIIAERSNKKTNERATASKVINIKKDLLIYAPDVIVDKYNEWNRFVSNHEGNHKHAKIFLELFILIRRDMGHPKTKIKEADILKLIMTSDFEVEQMKTLIDI